MIIFGLDGVLADVEHRRHFVEPYEKKWVDEETIYGSDFKGQSGYACLNKDGSLFEGKNWPAYHAACVDDKPIQQLISIFHDMHQCEKKVQIWTTRCESTREETVDWIWLSGKVSLGFCRRFCVDKDLKMRPVGDTTPAHKLKERWLDETPEKIDFVFETDPDSVEMYRQKGIFVFDCKQNKG